jgi:hypothetical protein
MLVSLSDLVAELPIVRLTPRSDLLRFPAPTGTALITKRTRVARSCPKCWVFVHAQVVGLTWHNPNPLIMVDGPEIQIEPVGIRRLPAGIAQVEGGDA